ncbi:MAG TPA: hypothetical protein VNU26_03080, partial [Mycobacteriales bacterium]|nr:hypothetical protein [Mycobacteriales bacterium]
MRSSAVVGEPTDLVDHVALAQEVDAALAADRGSLIDPLLSLEGTSEEAAAWQQVGELDRDATALHVRQALTIAHGY